MVNGGFFNVGIFLGTLPRAGSSGHGLCQPGASSWEHGHPGSSRPSRSERPVLPPQLRRGASRHQLAARIASPPALFPALPSAFPTCLPSRLLKATGASQKRGWLLFLTGGARLERNGQLASGPSCFSPPSRQADAAASVGDAPAPAQPYPRLAVGRPRHKHVGSLIPRRDHLPARASPRSP